MRRQSLWLWLLLLGHSAWAECGTVQLARNNQGQVEVSIDGTSFAVYNSDKSRPKPYFFNIRAPGGTLLSRPLSPPSGKDPHHLGIWIAVDRVSGADFWAERNRIENVSVKLLEPTGDPAVMEVVNHWLDGDRQPMVIERTVFRIHANRLLTSEITLTAAAREVTFGDTEEGFLAFRMAESMCEEETGRVVNAARSKTAKGCWGKTSDWVDYYGQVDGKTFGVAIFDGPQNFRRSRYHVRDYGLFTVSPFGEADYTKGRLPARPVTLSANASLRLRYGMYFHQGDTAHGNVKEVYQAFVAAAQATTDTPRRLREITFLSTADQTQQPAMFFAATTNKPVPLLVALHTWSGDYRQDDYAECVDWCRQKDWAYIQPDFRGPNVRPEATGSELVIQDIVDAVEFAKQRANVDPERIYLVGVSGGGYTALLMAGRKPELWAGVSAWVPISDLKAWYYEVQQLEEKHSRQVAASCGGAPGTSDEVDSQYAQRSPLTHLRAARSVALDINAGIRDGHEGSVPVSHSLRAFNAVVDADNQLSPADIQFFVEKAEVPPHLKRPLSDSSYGAKRPLFRRQSGRARVTIFHGGHEFIPHAALAWLENQRRRR